jgi:predicted nucleic acid-binding protein
MRTRARSVYTNHASPLVTPGPLRERMIRESASGSNFAIAAPCIAETVFGLGTLPRAVANLQNWQLLLSELQVLTIGLAQAERAANLQIELRKRGRQLATVDALTAAVALDEYLILLTTDGDFAAVPGLECENWLKQP